MSAERHDSTEAQALVDAACRGERRAIARLLSELERDTPSVAGLLAALAPRVSGAGVIGITGPPGAGKSTLVNALIREFRARGRRLGIIAVDPSSPVSGGAILGDRVRMTAADGDDGVFVRSIASGGALGGLTPAAMRMVDAIDAAGFDLVVLETVGTGQSEIDIAEVADVAVVIAAPGLGDGIQAMKAGLLEIADVLVVNKGDRPDAEQTRQHLMSALALRAGGGRDVAVLKTTAVSGDGVQALADAIEAKLADALQAASDERRRKRARHLIARASAEIVYRLTRRGSAEADRLADQLLRGEITAIEAARRLMDRPQG